MTMARMNSAPPSRKRRAWIDPRFLIGVVLVAASVIGVVSIVSAADTTTSAYATRSAIAPGDRIDLDDLVSIDVRLGAADELYLLPGDVPEDGLLVARAVAAGELVPASAVGSAAGQRLASVVVSVTGPLPAAIEPGSSVDLWAAPKEESNSFGPPTTVVTGATVVRIVESEAIVSGGEVTALEVLVPRGKVARVLAAIANGDALAVVPASIPVKG